MQVITLLFFLTWIIQNDFYNKDIFETEEIQLLKDEKISGTDFLMDHCDGKLVRQFINAEALDFIDYYYENKYFDDYCAFVEGEIKGTVLGIRFSWDMYHQFKPILDNAYKEYGKKH